MKPAYRLTIADRLGPDAYLLLRIVAWGIALAIIAAVIVVIEARGQHASGMVMLTRAVVAGLTVGALVTAGSLAYVHVAAAGASLWLAPRGSSCPPEPDFSLQDAMIMRGEVVGALHSFEVLIASSPTDYRVRLRAAEAYAGPGGQPRRARDLFREVRALPRVPAHVDVFASNRLVDLYLGPLNDPRSARAELRELASRHRDTPAGAQAAEALRRLGASVRAGIG